MTGPSGTPGGSACGRRLTVSPISTTSGWSRQFASTVKDSDGSHDDEVPGGLADGDEQQEHPEVLAQDAGDKRQRIADKRHPGEQQRPEPPSLVPCGRPVD